jgi:hypothetical protein
MALRWGPFSEIYFLNAPPKKREERGKKSKRKPIKKRRKPFFLAGKKENTGCVSTRAFVFVSLHQSGHFLAVFLGGGGQRPQIGFKPKLKAGAPNGRSAGFIQLERRVLPPAKKTPNYYFNAVMMPKRGRQNGSYYLLRYAFERLGDPLNLSI